MFGEARAGTDVRAFGNWGRAGILPAVIMIAILLATVVASVTGIAMWLVDQRLLRCGTVLRAGVAIILIVISIWVATLIQAALWLRVPGAYGPVQLWDRDPSATDFMSGPRVLSVFLIVGGLWLAILSGVASILSLFFAAERRRWCRLIIPVFAITVYVLARYWFIAYEFYPSA